MDANAPAWYRFAEVFPDDAKAARLTMVDSPVMAVDLLQKEGTVTLIDEHFLSHPQINGMQSYFDKRIELAQPLSMFTRKRARQPVPLVAFSKWLQAKLR